MYLLTGVFIGFTQRVSIVRENIASVMPISLEIHSNRKSKVAYGLRICITDEGSATVTSANNRVGAWDVAFFGYQDEISNVCSEYALSPGETEKIIMGIIINNDIISEANENFTLTVSIRILYQFDVRTDPDCYDEGEVPQVGNYYCSHTITILDDDG